MTETSKPLRAVLPSVDKLLRHDDGLALAEAYGRRATTDAVRAVIDELRQRLPGAGGEADTAEEAVLASVADLLAAKSAPSLKKVFNLTGTVLHTNLGRAPLPREAIEAMTVVAGGASNLEYDLESGRRGDRDVHVDDLLAELTGAEAATVVNNNAAAVLLVLNTLAKGKEVPVSRGQLVEIGGSFRMPDIIRRAGCKMHEVGTTNRTHLKDFEDAIGGRTALLLKVHTSNYEVQGFTKEVSDAELAELARKHGIPCIDDLGSGTLVDLTQFGLPHEPTAAEALAHGMSVVTFSGDKLLGGPQAGMIVGKRELIDKIKKNPMKRALRIDKVTMAALSAVLRLYLDPDRLVERMPVLRLLTRQADEIAATGRRIVDPVSRALDGIAAVELVGCQSQIGSGSLPVERLDSVALSITPSTGKRGGGAALNRIAKAFRSLPIPVIGRVHEGAFLLDLRCLEDVEAFVGQLDALTPGGASK